MYYQRIASSLVYVIRESIYSQDAERNLIHREYSLLTNEISPRRSGSMIVQPRQISTTCSVSADIGFPRVKSALCGSKNGLRAGILSKELRIRSPWRERTNVTAMTGSWNLMIYFKFGSLICPHMSNTRGEWRWTCIYSNSATCIW